MKPSSTMTVRSRIPSQAAHRPAKYVAAASPIHCGTPAPVGASQIARITLAIAAPQLTRAASLINKLPGRERYDEGPFLRPRVAIAKTPNK